MNNPRTRLAPLTRRRGVTLLAASAALARLPVPTAGAQVLGEPTVTVDVSNSQWRAVIVELPLNWGVVQVPSYRLAAASYTLQADAVYSRAGQIVGSTSDPLPVPHWWTGAARSPYDRGSLTGPNYYYLGIPDSVRGIVDITVRMKLYSTAPDGRLFKETSSILRAVDVRAPWEDPNLALYEALYQAMRLEAGSLTRSSSEAYLSARVVNRSAATVQVPLDPSRALYAVGASQAWIERLGPDSTIPTIPAAYCRDGARYAAGGGILVAPSPELAPGQGVDAAAQLDITGYPSGTYRLYLEYKPLDRLGSCGAPDPSGVLQTITADFVVP